MTKLQWCLVITLTAAAVAFGWPYLKDGYVGYYLSGRCPETTQTTIPQCKPPHWGAGGGGLFRIR